MYRKKRNESTIVVSSGHTLNGGRIYANDVDDAINCMGSDISVIGVTLIDTSGSEVAHKDFIQPIPKGLEPNAQFFGKSAEGLVFKNNKMRANSQMQGICAFDGLFVGIVITHNDIRTESQHQIHFNGVLSGTIHSNKCRVVLEDMRIGGNHHRSFSVASFVDGGYQPINTNGETVIIDRRGKSGGVELFDLTLFRKLSEAIPYDSFNQHFNDLMDAYEEHLIDDFAKEVAASGLVDKPASHIATNARRQQGESLSQMISSHEGGYTSYNRGRAGDAGNRVVPLLTIAEYIERGALPYSNPARIWAVGKYQYVPQTLDDARSRGVVDGDTVLTPAVQERIFIEWLLSLKRKSVYRYITTGVGLDRAMIDLSKEWASLPNPSTGKSHYAKRNSSDKAHTSVARVKAAMTNTRAIYLHKMEDGGLSKKEAFKQAVYNTR